MTTIKNTNIEAKLNEYQYPRTKQRIHVQDDGSVDIMLEFGFPVNTIQQCIEADIAQLLSPLLIPALNIVISSKISAHVTQLVNQHVPNIKNIIVVASGKGGVGKSTTAVNLAIATAQMGARVGLLDADIHGPNTNVMLGTQAQRVETKDKKFSPILAHGIQTISIAHLVEMNVALAWRGPMISKVLEQLLQDTAWDDLDYLFIDMPPGTGDIQLTLSKKIPVSGAAIVTTPQDVALHDVRRGVSMFNKTNIAVLGIIENMSQHVCSECGHRDAIFGEQGGLDLANELSVPLLGQLPLDRRIRIDCDNGRPSVIDSTSTIAISYRAVALRLMAELSKRKIDYAAKFPKISVVSDKIE